MSNVLLPGTQAPDFTLHATPDQTLALKGLRGRPVILDLYPADWSPVCGDQVVLYNELLPEFHRHHAMLLGISVDGVWCHLAFAKDRKLRFPSQETWNGIKIVRVRSTSFGKTSKWRRASDFGTFMASCALRLWLSGNFDVIVAMTSPPLISFLATLAVPKKARSLVFWSMDLNPDEAIAAGWLRPESKVARLLSGMSLHSMQRADCIVALDRFMRYRIQAKGVAAEKVIVVPPWSQDESVRFDAAGREEFRRKHELSKKFVVMYSGNHSPCHPLETLLQAAERLASNDEIAFCFVGGGSEFATVKQRAQNRGLRNVLCLSCSLDSL